MYLASDNSAILIPRERLRPSQSLSRIQLRGKYKRRWLFTEEPVPNKLSLVRCICRLRKK